MENETNAAASVDTNAQQQNAGTDNGQATATATAGNDQSQSQATDAGDQGTSQENNSNANSGNANEDVDYSTLVPNVTIEHDPNDIPDPTKDPAGYARFINDDQEKRSNFRNSELRGWQTLEKEFPEIKSDPELRQNILARRIYNAQNGVDGGLVEAGRSAMSPYSKAHAAGKTDAQVSIETQQGAGLNKATPARQDTGKPDLLTDFRRGNVEAGRSLVEQMLKDGKI